MPPVPAKRSVNRWNKFILDGEVAMIRLGPNLWNSLNNNTRELPRKSFKTEVHNMLLSFLASEDICIESPSIIQKLISTSPQ